MVRQKDNEKLQESVQFAKQLATIMRQMGKQSYPKETNHFGRTLSKLVTLFRMILMRLGQPSEFRVKAIHK